MKTVKVSELTSAALDWAVGKTIGAKVSKLGPGNKVGVWIIDGESWYETRKQYTPSTDWAQGGPIIELEKIKIYVLHEAPELWAAQLSNANWESRPVFCYHGSTPLIAAMRCYVASKLGDIVEVPKEIL